jgi:hypothetical protein
MPSIINATTTNGVAVSGDNSGSLALQTNNGTTAVTIDTSQNVGIGTSSPSAPLDIQSNSGGTAIRVRGRASANAGAIRYFANDNTTQRARIESNDTSLEINSIASLPITFNTADTERMRITSNGNLLINRTTVLSDGQYCADFNGNTQRGIVLNNSSGTVFANLISFASSGSVIASISQPTSSTVAYNTSSDYRLKENIAPMTGALNKVAQLKPVTYNWKIDGSAGQGFIAHELQAVVPDCVTGEKDAVDKDGNPEYQGVDTSFLVATLTAAIQELKAELDATKAEVQALKGA